MKTGINLATKKSTERKKLEYANFVFVAFGVVLLIAVITIAINVGLGIQSRGLSSQEDQLSSQISSQAAKKAKYLAVRDRVQSIQNIIKSRQKINDRMNALLVVLPQDLNFEEFSADATTVKMRVSTPNLRELDKMLGTDIINFAKDHKNGISQVNLSTFEIDRDSLSYVAEFTFTY